MMISKTRTNTLIVDRESEWLTVRFNQPHVRNALTTEMMNELVSVLERARDDRSIRGITFRGEGHTFCAGGDLKWFSQLERSEIGEKEIASFSRRAGEFFKLVDNLPQLTVMVVEGAAMGGGFGMACCGDVVIARQDARFSLSEVRVGLFPAQILPYVVNRMGRANARRAMLTAATLDGAEAARLGLVDLVASDAASVGVLERQVREQALKCAPGAVASTKALLHRWEGDEIDTYIDLAADAFANCLMGDEAREGTIAFAQRRKPSWSH